MNCTESHDLLLDLACGELPPDRAAEVTAHILSCAACTAEKAKLDDARKVASLLRELEEPPEGFDEPILRAARAEAGLQADGTPGPVVEVSATLKPLGLQAARLDPHARMRGGAGRPPPRWGRRAAAIGSIAAAAGLAVVVTSSLTSRHSQERAREVAPIQVRAPGAPAPTAIDDALFQRGKAAARKETAGAASPQAVAPPAPAPVPAPAPIPAPEVKVARTPAPKKKQADRDQKVEAFGQTEAIRLDEAPASPPAQAGGSEEIQGAIAFDSAERPPPPAEPPSEDTKRDVARKSALLKSAPAVSEAVSPPPPPSVQAVSQAPAQTVPIAGDKVAAEQPASGPDQLEDQAGAARRSGDYPRAAALYRDASALRRQSDPARAAWDLAHAVECLAAGGQVDEAIAARTELLRNFPGQPGPKAAADSALRSVPLPPDENPAKAAEH